MPNHSKENKIVVTSIAVVGRRWFTRGAGNTYHSAEIQINYEVVHKVPYAYGYGNQYEETAAEWLESNGFMPGRKRSPNTGGRESLQAYCDRHSVKYITTVLDVDRKKDL